MGSPADGTVEVAQHGRNCRGARPVVPFRASCRVRRFPTRVERCPSGSRGDQPCAPGTFTVESARGKNALVDPREPKQQPPNACRAARAPSALRTTRDRAVPMPSSRGSKSDSGTGEEGRLPAGEGPGASKRPGLLDKCVGRRKAAEAGAETYRVLGASVVTERRTDLSGFHVSSSADKLCAAYSHPRRAT